MFPSIQKTLVKYKDNFKKGWERMLFRILTFDPTYLYIISQTSKIFDLSENKRKIK